MPHPPILDFPDGLPSAAYHSCELQYQFDIAGTPAPLDAAQVELGRVMNAYWTNFARTGDPNGDDVPAWGSFAQGDVVQSLTTGDGGVAPVDFAAEHKLDFWTGVLSPEPVTATPLA